MHMNWIVRDSEALLDAWALRMSIGTAIGVFLLDVQHVRVYVVKNCDCSLGVPTKG